MMTEPEIQSAVLDRLNALSGSGNEGHLYHTDGVLRGLVWAMTGKDPGTQLTRNVPALLDMVGIPYELRDGMVWFDTERAGVQATEK